MNIVKQCKTCEFNFDGICAGGGDIYKYGDKITDDTKFCNSWGASLDFFSQTIMNAPRFLHEQFDDCQISYDEFYLNLKIIQREIVCL